MSATMNQEQREELPKIDSPELPLFSPVSAASTCNAAEPASVNSHHQMQYCDACNTACVFMNGRRRKLQVRYEGYVLVKRVPTASSFMRTSPYVTAQHAALPSYERRHSFAELLDDQTPADQPDGPAPNCNAYSVSVPPRTLMQLPWRKPDDDIMNHPPFEKLVNLAADENRVPVSSSASSSSLSTTHNSAVSQNSSSSSSNSSNISSYSSNTRLRREKKKSSHQRLCRKKSRSQDNLSGRRVNSSCVSEEGIILNNAIQPPPLTCSPLSRSEGSIHNVHATTLGGTDGDEGTAGDTGEGICGGVGELARLPKKLLTRVTDEVGQWVFDLEGWNEQYLTLNESTLSLRNSCGDPVGLEVPYSAIEEVQLVMPSGAKGHKYCIRLISRDTSLLLQASSSYTRDQWLHSILWKKNAFKYRNLLRTARRPEVLLKELKNLVDVSLAAPLHDPAVCQLPLDLASSILTGDTWLSQPMSEEVIVTLAPLLENNTPSPQICSFFSKHCCDAPRSTLVIDMFTPVVRRILKHNVDFGKYPHVRRFVQNYVQALNSQNAGERVVHGFVRSLHGPTSTCPHLRVLPNLVAVCTAAINSLTAAIKRTQDINNDMNQRDGAAEAHLACYISLLALICEYDDWRVGLAALLQPVPFPDDFLADPVLMRRVVPVIERIGRDPRCEVHQLVASSREHKEGWLQLLCPSSIACIDEGSAWANVLDMLISCCCRRKKFLATQAKSLGAFMLLALRNDSTAQEVLCLMLEWRLLDSSDLRMQVVTTLQSTPTGKRCYQDLCDRQMHLRELQQKGGPRKLTLPSRSTDADVIRLLSSGSFGNLQVLSLAFTRVTSECAHHLIKLPDLRYLNLWATQFGDQGLQLITEHLHKLQVLNLCETPVTDLGLSCLTALKNLRKLNLNSTSLSAVTFQELKAGLPSLQEVDVRYTDAW